MVHTHLKKIIYILKIDCLLLSSSYRQYRSILEHHGKNVGDFSDIYRRTKNLGLDIPLKLIQSSNFLSENSLCILLGGKNLTTMKKLKSKS